MANRVDGEHRGRPNIHDHVPLYLYVEVERRQRKLRVRALCALRDVRFERVTPLANGKCEVTYVAGETLRRRYREARDVLGLTNPHRHVHSEALEWVHRESKRLLDDIVAGLAE